MIGLLKRIHPFGNFEDVKMIISRSEIKERIPDQFAIRRAIQTIGITGIANPVMRRKIAMMTFSPRLASPQIDCHMSSIDCAVRCMSPAIRTITNSAIVNLIAAVSGARNPKPLHDPYWMTMRTHPSACMM